MNKELLDQFIQRLDNADYSDYSAILNEVYELGYMEGYSLGGIIGGDNNVLL